MISRHPFFLWFAVLGAVLLVAVWQWPQASPWLQTDMMALLPQPQLPEAVASKIAAAERDNRAMIEQRVLWLASGDDADAAVAHLAALKEALGDSGLFHPDENAPVVQMDALYHSLLPYRTALLTEVQREQIASDPQTFLDGRLARLMGPTAAQSASRLMQDPLLTLGDYLRPAAPPGLFFRGSTPMVKAEGQYWALLDSRLQSSGFDLRQQDRLLSLWQTQRRLAQNQAYQLLATGLPLYSAWGSHSAESEISTIGAISLAGITGLMLLVFRSPMPLALVLLPLAAGVVIAVAATVTAFGSIHLLTLVFGASLIGIAIDYAFHFLCDNFHRPWSPEATVRRVGHATLLGMVTSAAAFLALMAAPFPGLRQIGVFSATGLAGAWLTVMLVFPTATRSYRAPESSRFVHWSSWLARRCRGRPLGWILLILAAAVPGWQQLHPADDIRLLYDAPQLLVDSDRFIRKSLPLGWDSQYLIVSGNAAGEVLERNRDLSAKLDERVATGELQTYQSIARWLPSRQQQHRNHESIQSAFVDSGLLERYFNALGMDDQNKQRLLADYRRPAPELSPQQWQTVAPTELRGLWLGCGEQCSTIIRLRGIKDLSTLSKWVESQPDILLVDRVADISSIMQHYRVVAGELVFAALLLALLLLSWQLGLRAALRIIAVPTLAMIGALAVVGYSGALFSMFNVFALLLVLGIGIDYAIFYQLQGSGNNNPVSLAVAMSAITTALALGMLCFSSTPAISAFGTTLLPGIALAYWLAPRLCGNKFNDKEKAV